MESTYKFRDCQSSKNEITQQMTVLAQSKIFKKPFRNFLKGFFMHLKL